MIRLVVSRGIYLLFLSFLIGMGEVSANVGKVLIAVGEVSAQREQLVPLKRGGILLEQDHLLTGSKGRAQFLMVDGAKISLKPSSELFLEEYKFTTAADVVGRNPSSLSMSLIKGGFRTLSGAIGSGPDKSGYQVKTPIATIGIRGTDYSVLICSTGCPSIDGSGNVTPGLYIGVTSGSIVIQNSAGTLVLEANQYAYVASENTPPVRITTPPENLMSYAISSTSDETDKDDTDVTTTTDTTESLDSTDETDNIVKTDVAEVEPTPTDITPSTVSSDEIDNIVTTDIAQVEPTPTDIIPSTVTSDGLFIGSILPIDLEIIITKDAIAPDGSITNIDVTTYDFTNTYGMAFAGIFGSGNNFSVVTHSPLDSMQFVGLGLTGFYTSSPTTGIGTLYNIGSASQINVGHEPTTGLTWGRWSTGLMSTVSDSGITTQIDLSNSSFHWLLDNFQSSQPLPISGSASYTLIGWSDPTDNQGNIGILGTTTFFVDFTNQTVSNTLNLGIAGNVWSASGSGDISTGTDLFSGVYDNVTVNSVASGVGTFTGLFGSLLDSNTGLPAGAGLVYLLQDDASNPTEIINGTLIYGKPKP